MAACLHRRGSPIYWKLWILITYSHLIGLVEVDLNTLTVVETKWFPWTITAISGADATVPLTVGTTHTLHLYDSRSPAGNNAPEAEATLAVMMHNSKAHSNHPPPISILNMPDAA